MYRNNYPDEYNDPRSFIPDLYNFIIENNIKYLVDIHGLARKHPSEICVGTGRGELVNYDSNLVYLMDKSFDKVDIMLDLNSKFQGSNPRTICRNIYDQAKVPTTQFEINGNFRRPHEDLNSTDRVVYGLLKYIEEAENIIDIQKIFLFKEIIQNKKKTLVIRHII